MPLLPCLTGNTSNTLKLSTVSHSYILALRSLVEKDRVPGQHPTLCACIRACVRVCCVRPCWLIQKGLESPRKHVCRCVYGGVSRKVKLGRKTQKPLTKPNPVLSWACSQCCKNPAKPVVQQAEQVQPLRAAFKVPRSCKLSSHPAPHKARLPHYKFTAFVACLYLLYHWL